MIQRIFHYTSFETLKKIIEKRTIRFNSLLNVDDENEAITRDFGSLQAYYFSSCWTYDAQENEELWKLYIKEDFGVRISAPPDFLMPILDNNDEVINHANNNAVCRLIHRGSKKRYAFLEKIQYREGYDRGNTAQLAKSLRGVFSDDFIENFGLLKDRARWGFQKEIRFLIQAVPNKIIKKHISEYGDASTYNAFVEAIYNHDATDIEFIDLVFDGKWLEEFNFLVGQKTTDEEFQQATQYLRLKIPGFRGILTRSNLSSSVP